MSLHRNACESADAGLCSVAENCKIQKNNGQNMKVLILKKALA
jgi:hypothetical protein